jgi:hypothetical protein
MMPSNDQQEDVVALDRLAKPKPKRVFTLQQTHPFGPIVREYPKHLQKSFKEIMRAVWASKEYASTIFTVFLESMVSAGVPYRTAAIAACQMMYRMFNHEMRHSEVYKKAVKDSQSTGQ